MEVNSNELLDQLEHLLGRLTEIVEREFLPLSEQQLNWKPSPKRWSIAECLQHLNIISNAYSPLFMQQIELGVQKGYKARPKFRFKFMGNYAVRSVQLQEDNRLRNKIKSPKAYNPESSSSLLNAKEVLSNYLEYQEEMLGFVAASRAVDLSRVRIPIAIFKIIKFRLGDMLRFVIYHNERHIVQAQKVRTEAQFPRV